MTQFLFLVEGPESRALCTLSSALSLKYNYIMYFFLFHKSGGQRLAMIKHTCNPSTWDVEEGSQFGIILSHKANPHLRKGWKTTDLKQEQCV